MGCPLPPTRRTAAVQGRRSKATFKKRLPLEASPEVMKDERVRAQVRTPMPPPESLGSAEKTGWVIGGRQEDCAVRSEMGTGTLRRVFGTRRVGGIGIRPGSNLHPRRRLPRPPPPPRPPRALRPPASVPRRRRHPHPQLPQPPPPAPRLEPSGALKTCRASPVREALLGDLLQPGATPSVPNARRGRSFWR